MRNDVHIETVVKEKDRSCSLCAELSFFSKSKNRKCLVNFIGISYNKFWFLVFRKEERTGGHFFEERNSNCTGLWRSV